MSEQKKVVSEKYKIVCADEHNAKSNQFEDWDGLEYDSLSVAQCWVQCIPKETAEKYVIRIVKVTVTEEVVG